MSREASYGVAASTVADDAADGPSKIALKGGRDLAARSVECDTLDIVKVPCCWLQMVNCKIKSTVRN